MSTYATIRTTFTAEELTTLRTAYGTLERVLPSRLTDFHRLFDGCNNVAMCQLAQAGIKFVSPLARNELSRRGITA